MSGLAGEVCGHATCRIGGVALAALIAVSGLAAPARADSDGGNGRLHADEMKRSKSSLWTLISAKAESETASDAASQQVVITPINGLNVRAVAASGEEAVPEPIEEEAYDPLEPLNRLLFGLNEAIDMVVLRPVSFIYRTIVPAPVRQGVSNALANATSPVTFANDLLQGDLDRAQKTLVRFMVNSTAGFGGFVDAAAAAGIEAHTEDFGQTLGVWGVGAGPYLVAPVLGPTTVRDGAGRVVDLVFNPFTWAMMDLSTVERATPAMATVVTTHESVMDDLKLMRETSPDFYASVRDIYLQKRKTEIANGADADGTLEPIDSSR
jgi:phospholipid-binding lipoprotein MlaA